VFFGFFPVVVVIVVGGGNHLHLLHTKTRVMRKKGGIYKKRDKGAI